MNDQISWDQSLVRKYGSSNHFKMLNQLRNEVKKYPLYRKKSISLNKLNDQKINSHNNLKKSTTDDISPEESLIINNEIKGQISTVSFNNSKNFSIYNNSSTNKIDENHEDKILENKENIEAPSTSTFKDRLNQIDMK